jgi:hypothetical protein
MSEDDFDVFASLLDAAYSLYGKPLSAEAKAIHFRALSAYPLAAVRGALEAHVKDAQRGQFPPKPADLMVQLEGKAANDGRPGADEAWAIALSAQDEAATIVWTDEIAQAFSIARPVLDQGDKVGARMAFKDAYHRLVQKARQAGHMAHWQASLGWDAELREPALMQAVSTHRLPAPVAAALLPAAANDDYDVEKARANLKRIRELLAAMPSAFQRARTAREARLHAQRQAVQAKKDEVLKQVERYAYLHWDKLTVFPLLTYEKTHRQAA